MCTVKCVWSVVCVIVKSVYCAMCVCGEWCEVSALWNVCVVAVVCLCEMYLHCSVCGQSCVCMSFL